MSPFYLFVCEHKLFERRCEQLQTDNPALILPRRTLGARHITVSSNYGDPRAANSGILFWAKRIATERVAKLVRGRKGYIQLIAEATALQYDADKDYDCTGSKILYHHRH